MATTPATESEPKSSSDFESERIHSYNSSNATFLQKASQPCYFRTANCPDQCVHARITYTFRINSLNVVTNPDSTQAKYCTPIAEGAEYRIDETSFVGIVSDSDSGSGSDGPSLKEIADSLVEGDTVELSWNHDYVKRGMAYSPEYPVTKLVKL
mmetsp:Transcript_17998/g.22670  ORF Transcript_17998/g.22670 Transcript_17998/m.22670 type:complete len:154 (+) Transcript_17998:91-552(+)